MNRRPSPEDKREERGKDGLERGSLDLRSERPKRSLWQKIVDLALTDARTLDGGFDEVSVEELERTLLESDFGVEVTMELVAELERAAERGRAGSESDLRTGLRQLAEAGVTDFAASVYAADGDAVERTTAFLESEL